MKNIFKYLSAFAIAGAVGLNVMNVRAADACTMDDGTKGVTHTNYYLFLNVTAREDLVKALTDNGNSLTQYNGTTKLMNRLSDKITKHGKIELTTGLTNEAYNQKWTLEEFWDKYKATALLDEEDTVYTVDTNHYITHRAWWDYKDENDFNNSKPGTYGTDKNDNPLLVSLKEQYLSKNDIAPLLDATVLPKTEIYPQKGEYNKIFEGITSLETEWKISRMYSVSDAEQDIPKGVELTATANNQEVTKEYIYAPAVYQVTFCVNNEKAVTYDANTTDQVTGMPNPEKQKLNDEGCVNVDSAKPVRQGYTFLGWNTNKDAQEADAAYTGGTNYCPKESVTLYAIWKENKPFTVEYDANVGGKDAPAKQTAEPGTCVTISSQKPTSETNTFLGWSTNKDAQEADPRFDGGKEYCGEQGNITLYAVWQPKTGISAHGVAFTLIALTAGAALLVAKKKNLFKQI